MIIEHIMEKIIPYITGSLETIGIAIIAYSCLVAIIKLAKNKFNFNKKEIKIGLARGLAFSLEFKLAAEIIHSVTVRTFDEIIVLGAIVALRVILTFVIEWEIKNDSAEIELESQKKDSL